MPFIQAYPAAYREMWRGVAITEEPRNEMRAEILENTCDCHPQRSNDAHDSGGPSALDRRDRLHEADHLRSKSICSLPMHRAILDRKAEIISALLHSPL